MKFLILLMSVLIPTLCFANTAEEQRPGNFRFFEPADDIFCPYIYRDLEGEYLERFLEQNSDSDETSELTTTAEVLSEPSVAEENPELESIFAFDFNDDQEFSQTLTVSDHSVTPRENSVCYRELDPNALPGHLRVELEALKTLDEKNTSKEEIKNSIKDSEKCPVCLKGISWILHKKRKIGILNCGRSHMTCVNCLEQAPNSIRKCFICRGDLKPIENSKRKRASDSEPDSE